jgi:hypothetical protein
MMPTLLTLAAGVSTWTERDSFLEPIFGPYSALLGEPLLGSILGGSIILGFYISTDNIIMPSVVTLLLGGVLLPVLPGSLINVARTIIILGLATGFLAVARRYLL